MSDGQASALVVDASAAIAVIRREPSAAQLRSVLRQASVAGQRLLVPDAFWIELANVLARRYTASPDDIVESLREVDELGIESIGLNRGLILVVVEVQQRHRLSAYDAVYLALAQAEDAQLLTLDIRLAAAAGERAIRLDGHLPRRLSEALAEYGHDAEPIDWARFGPYLARLRAEARAEAGALAGQ